MKLEDVPIQNEQFCLGGKGNNKGVLKVGKELVLSRWQAEIYDNGNDPKLSNTEVRNEVRKVHTGSSPVPATIISFYHIFIMTEKTRKSIIEYAQALIKNGLCDTKIGAYRESIRWHPKAAQGLVEPLKCYPSPNPKIEVTYVYKS